MNRKYLDQDGFEIDANSTYIGTEPSRFKKFMKKNAKLIIGSAILINSVVGVEDSLPPFYNYKSGDFYGINVAASNVNAANFKGINVGVLNTSNPNSIKTGLEVGLFNVEKTEGWSSAADTCYDGTFVGARAGIFNSTSNFTGFQLAAVNLTKQATGLQIGLYNDTSKDLRGVQLGLINHSPETGYTLLVNWDFK